MPRNTELIHHQYGTPNPLPAVPLADNALHLGGIAANFFVIRDELEKTTGELSKGLLDIIKDLDEHKGNDVRHLTEDQIQTINKAIDAAEALKIAKKAIEEISATKKYVDDKVEPVNQEVTAIKGKVTTLDSAVEGLQKFVDGLEKEGEDKSLAEILNEEPQKIINSEFFYRFKNMVDNSSFEVFDGNTLVPYGWDGGISSAEASMFNGRSLKLVPGDTVRQSLKHLADVTWLEGAYDTEDVIIAFYHKFDAAGIRVYDVVNGRYLDLTALDSQLNELNDETAEQIIFAYAENWNQNRCMVKFTPLSTTKQVRIEFNYEALAGNRKNECYIDAVSMEPYIKGEFPSIYKDGRYSVSADQVLNPPPSDVDRFTPLEHFNIGNSISDDKGNITYQELLRANGTLAIKREATNPDANGYYQTIVETFYKKDGETINYIDTYTFTYSQGGAVLAQSKETTEVMA